eukprot:TRINITY_DN22903_c0_g1_i1.p1 TRINITY_DN22903_c0_g1~~TRINITY_DN22903_c0_g1_i1.p1  ORF type:complete len:137 (-),score=23.21 TRINITY_DN22903_c0_g1_i1:319-729(-)
MPDFLARATCAICLTKAEMTNPQNDLVERSSQRGQRLTRSGSMMANEDKTLEDLKPEEAEMRELGSEELQSATGGSFLGDVRNVAGDLGADIGQAFDKLTGSGQNQISQIGPVIASPGMNVVDPELDGGPGPEIEK